MENYTSTDKTQLTEHFNVSEFKCKCGGNHDTKLDTDLVNKLEKLHTTLKCSKIIVNSGYRCSTHDKNVGGNGSGMHTKGQAADIVCYDKNGNKISSKIVCCAAQDIGFGGIANIDSSYTATHVDTRTVKWFGNEVNGYNYSIPYDSFYTYYGLSKKDVYGSGTLEVTVIADGKVYVGEIHEK